MHLYRTHNCGEISEKDENSQVKISGWVHRKRDHGSLLFVDLRDHFGLTQCVVDSSDKVFTLVESLRNESVVTITGVVKKRSKETINKNLKTGQIEVSIEGITIQSAQNSQGNLAFNRDNGTTAYGRISYQQGTNYFEFFVFFDFF